MFQSDNEKEKQSKKKKKKREGDNQDKLGLFTLDLFPLSSLINSSSDINFRRGIKC